MTDWAAVDKIYARSFFRSLRADHVVDDEVKLATWNFPAKKFKRVELIHLTDMQIGAKNFMRERFREYTKWILSEKSRFVLLGGDIIDAATVLSVGTPHDNDAEPRLQVNDAIELLAPLRDKGRLLGYVGGNHERRTVKTFGDSGALIAQMLKVPYSRGVLNLDINFGAHKPFKVSLWHGGGGAQTDGGKLNVLSRFVKRFDSQLYLVGHLHDAFLKFWWPLRRVGNELKHIKTVGVMSSSFLSYFNSYAEVACLDPSDTLMWRCILEPDGHWEMTAR